MESRNIQKTGNMHYVYLPTSWCRDHKITSKSKVSISYGSDGSIIISPQVTERKRKHLSFTIKETDQDIIHKLVVASYINPVQGFEINLTKAMDFTKLLNQKRLISLESVEIDSKQITCEGTSMVANPDSLLRTMVKKIKNMIMVTQKTHDHELLGRYEDEIDRSKLLIDKSIISSLTFDTPSPLSNIELYYISMISKELEGLVDHLIELPKKDQKILDDLLEPIQQLDDMLQDRAHISLEASLRFSKAVRDVQHNSKAHSHVTSHLNKVAEVVMDWMVTQDLEN